MLEATDQGNEAAEQLWHKPRKDDIDMAYLAAIDIIGELPIMDATDLANRLPFIRATRKLAAVKDWIEEVLIER